jgi:hypothetical protein
MFLASCLSLIPTFAHDELSTLIVIFVALLVATTISLVDRLFFQADWFAQAERETAGEATSWPLRRWFIAAVRIGLSISVAIVVAGFIDLFLFRSDIDQQIERMVRRENASAFAQIEQRKQELDDRLSVSKNNLTLAEDALRAAQEKEVSVRGDKDSPTEFDKEISQEEHSLTMKTVEERSVRAEIARNELERDTSPVHPGVAPTAQYFEAIDKLRLSNAHLNRVLSDKMVLEAKLDNLTKSKQVAYDGDLNFFHNAVEQARAERDSKLARYQEEARVRDNKIAEYTAFVMAQPTFVKTEKGLFNQVLAYDQLKQAWPIWWESVATTLFIIFIEAAPILAKIFFSPSSVYAISLAKRVSDASSTLRRSELDDRERIAEAEKIISEKEMARRRTEEAFKKSIGDDFKVSGTSTVGGRR